MGARQILSVRQADRQILIINIIPAHNYFCEVCVSAKSLTTWTWCRHSRTLRGHGVGIVVLVHYADTMSG